MKNPYIFQACHDPATLRKWGLEARERGAIVVLDIGFSSERASCGLASEVNMKPGYGQRCENLDFGDTLKAIDKVIIDLKSAGINELLLLIEAPLSVRFENRCPASRKGQYIGRFTAWNEQDKAAGWYHGSGILTFNASYTLLKLLSVSGEHSAKPFEIRLVEVYSTAKPPREERCCDSCEAKFILGHFKRWLINDKDSEIRLIKVTPQIDERLRVQSTVAFNRLDGQVSESIPLIVEVDVPAIRQREDQRKWLSEGVSLCGRCLSRGQVV